MLNLALVSEQQGHVRNLAGFRKSHHVPDECSERSQAFVWRIAAGDISKDLDLRFADFRCHLGLKRFQMKVSEPKCGFGNIATPAFRYQISAALCRDNPSAFTWKRQVFGFTTAESVLSASFSATFGTMFDTVEFAPAEPVDVESFIDWIEQQTDRQLEADYDRMATWCRLTAPQHMASTMLIQSHAISLKTAAPCYPQSLLMSFFAFRELLPAIPWAG